MDMKRLKKILKEKIERIGVNTVPQSMTLEKLEEMKSIIKEKEITLSKFDEQVVNFIIPDEVEVIPQELDAFKDQVKVNYNPNEEYFKKDANNYGDNMFQQEYHDDTDIDLVKVMHHINADQKRYELEKEDWQERLKYFHDIKEMLETSRQLVAPILENGKPFDPKKVHYYVPKGELQYNDVEWKQIQFTGLGRRLTNYFDGLKADRKMLTKHVTELMEQQEIELNTMAFNIKAELKKAF